MRFRLLCKKPPPIKKLRGWVFFIFLLAAATARAQTVTISFSSAPIESVFEEIKNQTGFGFIYTSEGIKNAKPVSISVNNSPLKEALELVFKDQPLAYSIQHHYVVVTKKTAEEKKQSFEVRGRVVDEKGEAVQGASVKLKGTNQGVATDNDGSFLLKTNEDRVVLTISSVGFESKDVLVTSDHPLSIELRTSLAKLDEQVVIAYGKVSRRLNTGDVSRVSSEEISSQPVYNVLEALESRVPGMVVTQSSGLPGSSLSVYIRGRTALDRSITDDQPLFIIDGVPYAPNNHYLSTLGSALGTPSINATMPGGLSPFANINPYDIESIEVLKDADATAIYGSRGANGVVLITTKKGKAGKAHLSLNVQAGASQVTQIPQMLNTAQYLQMRHEAFFNDNQTPTTSNAFDFLSWDSTRESNLGKLLIGGTANNFDVQTSYSGGNSLTQFLLAGSYHLESTVYPGDAGLNRATAHFNLTHRSSDQKMNLTLSTSYSTDQSDLLSSDLTSLLYLPPNLRIYDSSGKLAWNEGGIALLNAYNNPLAYLNQSYSTTTQNFLSDLNLSYRFGKYFDLKLNAGFNTIDVTETETNPLIAQNPLNNPVRSGVFVLNTFRSWILEPHLSYDRQFGKLKLNTLAGGSMQNQQYTSNNLTGTGYLSDDLLGSLSGASATSAGRSSSAYRYAALFGRFNLNWSNKYLLNVSGRRDGSSRFGPGKEFSNFGSVGAAWIFTNEKLFSKLFPILSFGKLRTSYGTTGNDKISDYQYLDYWTSTFQPYQDGSGLKPSKLYNPDYRWEQTTKLELGLDLAFFHDRLSLSASYYRNRSSNQLIQYRLPGTTGFSSIIKNFPALVENSGMELELATENIKTAKFFWRSMVNLSVPNSKLVNFPGLESSSYSTQYAIGQPLNVIFNYKSLGVDPQTGVFLLEDSNGDGVLNSLDYQVNGKLDPKFFGGFQNNFQLKNWQLSIFLQFVKQTGKNFWASTSFLPGTIYNMPKVVLSRWKEKADQSTVQKFSQATGLPPYNVFSDFHNSSGVYSDASYVRVKTISLSYSLPDNLLKRVHVSTGKFYLNAENLFTITNYEPGDPETQNYLRMPPLKTWVAGIQLNF